MKGTPSVLRVVLIQVVLEDFIRAIFLKEEFTMFCSQTFVSNLSNVGLSIVEQASLNFLYYPRHCLSVRDL